MTLPIIYIAFLILTFTLFFLHKEGKFKYKKWLILAHIIFILLLSIDIFLLTKYHTSFKSLWVDRVIAIGFLISGTVIFALYCRTLSLMAKVYFGIFFIYPVIAGLIFIFDRVLFLIVASPLILTLLTPEIYYSDKDYEIRSFQGSMGLKQIRLIKKYSLTEEEIGKCRGDYIGNENYTSFKIIKDDNRFTTVSVKFGDQQRILTFKK